MSTNNPLPDQPGFLIVRHYLADLSLECPFGRIPDAALNALQLGQTGNVAAFPLGDDRYRLDISLQLTANIGDQTVFLAELTYRAEIRLHLVAEDRKSVVLYEEATAALKDPIRQILETNGSFVGYPELKLGDLSFSVPTAPVPSVTQ